MATQPFPQQNRRYGLGNLIMTVGVMVLLGYLAYQFIPGAKNVVPSLPSGVATAIQSPSNGDAYMVGQSLTVASEKRQGVANTFTVTAIDKEHVTVKDADGDAFQCSLATLSNLEQMQESCQPVKEPRHVSVTGYHVDADGHSRPNMPAGLPANQDCKSQGLRLYVVNAPKGSEIEVSKYYCAP